MKSFRMKKRVFNALLLGLFVVLQAIFSSSAFAALGQPIGEVALAKGVATARSSDRDVTALAKSSPVYKGDVLETAARSFLVVKFNDGGKITLRPDSQFEIDEFDDTPGKEKESFKLIKGGLRAVTGAIGKNRPDQVSYKAKNTTIGIRGTTFVLKLCEPGMDGCVANEEPDDEESSDDASQGEQPTGDQPQGNQSDEQSLVDIFVVDKNGGRKEKITRNNLRQILDGIYVFVEDGGVRFDLGGSYVDINQGDSCLAGSGDVQCFSQGVDFEKTDISMSVKVDDLADFDLFDDTQISVGGQVCEID